MFRIKMGFYSGLVATLISGCMLLMKNALHTVPQLHVTRSLAALLGSHDSVMPGVIAMFKPPTPGADRPSPDPWCNPSYAQLRRICRT